MSSAAGGAWVNEPGTRQSREYCERALRDGVPIKGTEGERYLVEQRGLQHPLWEELLWLPNARTGEGALISPLSVDGTLIGAQATFVDALGLKSVVEPSRETWKLHEKPSPGAVFALPARGGDSGEVVICDGLEDAHCIWTFARPRSRVIGLPGQWALQHLHFPVGTRILVAPDGDPPESQGALWLRQGTDSLLLQGCEVLIAPIPPVQAPKLDANQILLETGVDGLRAWIDQAVPAELSLDGEIERLSRLSGVDYELAREDAVAGLRARGFKVRISFLDEAVRKARERVAAAAQSSGPDWSDIEDEEVDLREILDGILAEVQRYIVADAPTLATVTLWCAFTHLVHHERVRVWCAPRLAIQALAWGSGKTVLLEVIANLVHNPRPSSSITASTLLRSVGVIKPTLLIDEAHRILRRDRSDELVAIANASHRRTFAFVERSVPMPDGSWVQERFDVWHTAALAGIGELPPEQQDRSIVVQLRKALADEVPEHLEDGTSAELLGLHRKLEIWAHKLDTLDRPGRPEILRHQPGRVFDNWRMLIAIASRAGGKWPALVEQAIAEAVGTERRLTLTERLLISIRKAFTTRTETIDFSTGKPAVAGPFDRLETQSLLDMLRSDEGEEWSTANRGKGITEYWLRDHLRGLLDPPRSQQWWDDPDHPDGKRKKRKGYLRRQFEKAWKTHLAGIRDESEAEDEEHIDSSTSGVSGSSGSSCTSEQNQQDDRAPPSGSGNGSSGSWNGTPIDNPIDNPILNPIEPDREPDHDENYHLKSTAEPDEPDEPDPQGNGKENTQPNGLDFGTVEEGARYYRRLNPRWSLARIAKELAVPVSRIEELFPDESPTVAKVRKARAEHPEWTLEQIVKHVRRPKSVVSRALASIGQ
jgi:Protein of unknown function (DUF3631)